MPRAGFSPAAVPSNQAGKKDAERTEQLDSSGSGPSAWKHELADGAAGQEESGASMMEGRRCVVERQQWWSACQLGGRFKSSSRNSAETTSQATRCFRRARKDSRSRNLANRQERGEACRPGTAGVPTLVAPCASLRMRLTPAAPIHLVPATLGHASITTTGPLPACPAQRKLQQVPAAVMDDSIVVGS